MAISQRAQAKENGSVALKLVQRLREGIFNGQFLPGQPLQEIRLAKEFGVSQATVREALQKLEHSGLVIRTPNVGTTVIRLSPADIRERVAIRVLLEVKAAQQAARGMTAADFIELEAIILRLGEAVESNDYFRAVETDLEFHRTIWQHSGNRTLATLLEQVTVPLIAFVSILRSNGLQLLTDVVLAHQPLIEALRSKDDRLIAEAFQTGAEASYLEFMGSGGFRSAVAFGFLDGQASVPLNEGV